MNNKIVERNKEIILIKWVAHISGTVKLNVDGACIKDVVAGYWENDRDDNGCRI